MKNIFKNRIIYIFVVLIALLSTGYYFSTPKLVEITMKDVITQINNKDFVTAKKRFDFARKINNIATRKYIKQLSDICISKIESNDYNSANEIIAFIEQLSPSKDTDYAKKLITLGKAKMGNGLYDKATKYFDIALIFDSSLSEIYLQKGKILLKENVDCYYACDYSKIIELLSSAIDLDDNSAEAYAYRGAAYYSSEETNTKAFSDINKAITLNNSKEATALAYSYRAVMKYEEKDFDGFWHDRSIALSLKNELQDKMDYAKGFVLLKQTEQLMCALYDICI